MSSTVLAREKPKRTEGTYRRDQMIGKIIRVIILVILCIFALFPVLWVFSASINPQQSMQSQTLIPQGVDSLEKLTANYNRLLTTKPFFQWTGNSILVASITSVFTVMITALSAYSFSRFRFYGRQSLLLFILLVQVFPNLLAMVAIYLMLLQIGRALAPVGLDRFFGLNSLGGLIMVYVGGAMGVNIWLMKGFFDSVPRDIDESAQVDGATHWQTYWLLIFPLVRPILIVVGILSFVGTFNEFVLARVLLLGSEESKTLMVGLWSFISDNFAKDWGVFAAGAVLGAIPTLVIYLLLQDQIVGGLTQGAVKG
jgi:arabinogalactan oligomer / maltooligosaccharide transport system permease protein